MKVVRRVLVEHVNRNCFPGQQSGWKSHRLVWSGHLLGRKVTVGDQEVGRVGIVERVNDTVLTSLPP